jgi:site-specific DNA-cytosine methylase
MTNYETTISIPTYVSLCSGYDGIGIGLKRAIPGLRTIAHVEIETYAIANLISKMEAGLLDACPVFTDLKQFPYEQLRDRVTILSAGFPCQPFSSAGKRRATEDERHLYPYIADGITAMRPRYVLLENVEGIISAKTADGESVLKYVLGDLEERGYRCTRDLARLDGPQDQVSNSTSGSNQGSPKLNPAWVCQLMGLPSGWTNLGCWATE